MFAGTASAEGHLAHQGIAPGAYRLDVVDEQKSRWLSEQVQVV